MRAGGITRHKTFPYTPLRSEKELALECDIGYDRDERDNTVKRKMELNEDRTKRR